MQIRCLIVDVRFMMRRSPFVNLPLLLVTLVVVAGLSYALLTNRDWSGTEQSESRLEAPDENPPQERAQEAEPDDDLIEPKQQISKVFSDVDDVTKAKLAPWLQDEYLPSVPHLERNRIVKIDAQALADSLRLSSVAFLGQLTDSRIESIDQTDLLINLFPDTEYRITVNEFEVGRYGNIRARASIVEGVSGRARVYFEVNPDSTVYGSIRSGDGLFRIYPSPELPYYVVTQANLEESFRSISIE